MKTWKLNDGEFRAMLSATNSKRYEYFIKRVADWESVWSLANDDGWVLAGEDGGSESVPVWPHPKYATASAVEVWAGCEPKAISLKDWMTKWLPGMVRDGRSVTVFPTPALNGVVVEPHVLAEDIREETTKYGDD